VSDSAVSGFWSYVHEDDDAEGGRLCRLADLLRDAYALQTAETLRLFVDRDSIEWGEDWRRVIENALADITFFIPIVTPRYFKSEECRKELLRFSELARSQGVEELVLPILYADVPGLETDALDPAMAIVARRQWEDWRTVRLESDVAGSPKGRCGPRGPAGTNCLVRGIKTGSRC